MKKSCNFLIVMLSLLVAQQSQAQIPKTFAFGFKAGLNHMSTQLVKQPRNYIVNLGGVRNANGFQAGVWATVPLNRWLFIDTDLGFIQKGNQRYNPPIELLGSDNYRYLNLSTRLGATYKGVFVSVGPEANVLLNKSVTFPITLDSSPVEWAVNARLGYQHRQLRADVFYSKGLSLYDKSILDVENQRGTLFYSKTIGFSLGIQLFNKKESKK